MGITLNGKLTRKHTNDNNIGGLLNATSLAGSISNNATLTGGLYASGSFATSTWNGILCFFTLTNDKVV